MPRTAKVTRESAAPVLRAGVQARPATDAGQVRVLQALAHDLGVDVFLAEREGMEMLIVEYCSTQAEAAEFGVGSLLPLAHTAAGRAWLWAQKPALQGEYIERIRAQADERALNAIPGIYRAFQDLAERGYCLAFGEWLQDQHAIALPLAPGGRREVLALAAVARDQRLKEPAFRDRVAAGLMDAAARIRNEVARVERA